jgi:hypothetical protein
LDILLESYESIVGHKMYGNGYTIQDLNESDYNKYGVYINDDYAFVTANPRNFDTSNTISWQQKGRKMAQGGLTEHGLKVGDKIERKLDAEGSVIKVKNKRENAYVVLDSGFRNPIPKMAQGGGLGDYFNKFENDFSSTRRGGVKNYSVDIDLENGEQLRGGDLDFKDGNDALLLYEKVKKVGEYENEPIEDIQLIANFKNGDYESLYVPKYANGGGVYSSDDLYELLVFDVETGVFLGSERFRAKNIREAQEMGQEYEDKYKKKYRENLRFKVQLAPSMFQEKGGLMANGGGVDSEITLYKVVGYYKASDFDNKTNGFVIADDYITKIQAENTMYEWKRKKTYPYIEIKEYKGKDPYKKFANGGAISGIEDIIRG